MSTYTTNNKKTEHKFLMYLISASDIIMLNACFVVLYYGLYIQTDFLFVLLAVNCLAIIGLRQWLSYSLQIPWLYSPFNRAIKRGGDIIASTLFILTGLPILYIVQAIYTKKKHGGSIVKVCHISMENGKSFNAIAFKENAMCCKFRLDLMPIAFNIIYGQLSIWDLKNIKEVTIQTEKEASPFSDSPAESITSTLEASNPLPDESTPEANFKETTTSENIEQADFDNNDNNDEHI